MNKKNFKWDRDRISAVVIALFAVFILINTRTIEPVFASMNKNEPGSRLFPTIVGTIMLICSVGKFLFAKGDGDAVFLGGLNGWIKIGIILLILAAYIFILPYLGYWISTIIATMVLVYAMKRDNHPKWYFVLLFAVILTAVLYGVFGMVLKVRLPYGSFIPKF